MENTKDAQADTSKDTQADNNIDNNNDTDNSTKNSDNPTTDTPQDDTTTTTTEEHLPVLAPYEETDSRMPSIVNQTDNITVKINNLLEEELNNLTISPKKK